VDGLPVESGVGSDCLLADEQGEAREAKRTRHLVDHVRPGRLDTRQQPASSIRGLPDTEPYRDRSLRREAAESEIAFAAPHDGN